MFNADQEDKIRNLLTIVSLYFQSEERKSKPQIIAMHKELCRQAIRELIPIMSVDGSIRPQEALNGHQFKLVQFGNIILDNLGYEKEGREIFISKCLTKL